MPDQTLPPLPTVFGDDDAASAAEQVATSAPLDPTTASLSSPADDVPVATSLPSLEELNKMFSDKAPDAATPPTLIPASETEPEKTDTAAISAPPSAPEPLTPDVPQPISAPDLTTSPAPALSAIPEPSSSPSTADLPSLADLNATLDKVAPESAPVAADDITLPSFLAASSPASTPDAAPSVAPATPPTLIPASETEPEKTDTAAISAPPSSEPFSLSPVAMIDQQLAEIESQLAAINAKIMSLTADSEKLTQEIEKKQYTAQVLEYTLSASQNYLAQLNQQKTDLLTAKQHITS